MGERKRYVLQPPPASQQVKAAMNRERTSRQTKVKSIHELQRELSLWTESHSGELSNLAPPSTAWHGVMSKCVAQVEELVFRAVAELVHVAGEHGVEAVRKVANGKPLEKLTLGELSKILPELHPQLHEVIAQRLPELRTEVPILEPPARQLLAEIIRLRNDFVHPKPGANYGNANAVTFLDKAARLGALPLITLAAKLEGLRAH